MINIACDDVCVAGQEERLSTAVTPSGQLIFTPLSAYFKQA
jgi:hypothetical protein